MPSKGLTLLHLLFNLLPPRLITLIYLDIMTLCKPAMLPHLMNHRKSFKTPPLPPSPLQALHIQQLRLTGLLMTMVGSSSFPL
ncbi:hypothetical protein DL96DRAFT_1629398 [Flagelloscypha sp. PMI_526]|nr:hypothetical protein DL96DRAFT_1629398 [Flagelloscypha sp. PMI_526]